MRFEKLCSISVKTHICTLHPDHACKSLAETIVKWTYITFWFRTNWAGVQLSHCVLTHIWHISCKHTCSWTLVAVMVADSLCLNMFLSAVAQPSFQRRLLTQHATGLCTRLTELSIRVWWSVCVYAGGSFSARMYVGFFGGSSLLYWWLVSVHVFVIPSSWVSGWGL